MSISTTLINESRVLNPHMFNTDLDSSSSTPKEPLGRIRWDYNPKFGTRGFIYSRVHQSGGCTAGQLMSFRANVAVTNIDSGTVNSITKAATFGTDNAFVGAALKCSDDAGAAGAAPEGEIGIIAQENANTLVLESGTEFSVAPAVNDDFLINLWGIAVVDSAAGDEAWEVAGVAMADHGQYDYGWFQFKGPHPLVDAIAAGTAIPAGESVIAGTALVTDGAGANTELLIGLSIFGLASDTVLRKDWIVLNCGPALVLGNTSA